MPISEYDEFVAHCDAQDGPRFKVGDPVEVLFMVLDNPFQNLGKGWAPPEPHEEWRPATVLNCSEDQVSVQFSDHTRHAFRGDDARVRKMRR